MGIAEEIAELWAEVGNRPQKGREGEYYAELLRKTMLSKKKLAETGRPYTILPSLRELVRKQMVRVPAEHVPFLEISVFDLVANPLKTGLQKHVSQFTNSDLPLVEWFVKASKKDLTLCLNAKALGAWLAEKKPKEPETQVPETQNTGAFEQKGSDKEKAGTEEAKPEDAGKETSETGEATAPGASNKAQTADSTPANARGT